LNADADPPLFGVVIDHDSGEISRLLRVIGQRVKLMVLSTKVHGGGVTLARLASINKRSDLNVALIVDERGEIPERERMNLTNLVTRPLRRNQPRPVPKSWRPSCQRECSSSWRSPSKTSWN
ncbi:MAG: hypothetical protein VX656_02695, partial [Candidatus Latescibacterota bacterium]|nr:hypothetical protein [Candidatus Latescibacterota bacterium]